MPPEPLSWVHVATAAGVVRISWDTRTVLLRRLREQRGTLAIVRVFEAVGATRPVELTDDGKNVLLGVVSAWLEQDSAAEEIAGPASRAPRRSRRGGFLAVAEIGLVRGTHIAARGVWEAALAASAPDPDTSAMTVIWTIAKTADTVRVDGGGGRLDGLLEYVFWLFAVAGPLSLGSGNPSTTAGRDHANEGVSGCGIEGTSSP